MYRRFKADDDVIIGKIPYLGMLNLFVTFTTIKFVFLTAKMGSKANGGKDSLQSLFQKLQ